MGNVLRFEAHVIADEFFQQEELDHDIVYAPIEGFSFAPLKLLIYMSKGWKI